MTSCLMRIRPGAAAACLLLAGTTHAAAHTSTVSKSGLGVVVMPLFDSALGTLLSVYAEASYSSTLPFFSIFPSVVLMSATYSPAGSWCNGS